VILHKETWQVGPSIHLKFKKRGEVKREPISLNTGKRLIGMEYMKVFLTVKGIGYIVREMSVGIQTKRYVN